MEKSLKNIQLPSFVLVDLYKDEIVCIEAESKPHETIKPTAINTEQKWFLGEGKKRIVIVVQDAESVFLNDDAYTLLSSILTACKLNVGDVAIVNIAKTAIDFYTLFKTIQPLYLLMFDNTHQKINLPFSLALYQITKQQECTFLAASSLYSMQGNTPEAKAEKGKLWNALQQFFKL